MMVGEMDFSDMFARHVTKAGIVPSFHMPYPVVTTIYFLVFVAMISILLMNLLVGVAIDNVTGVQDSAIIDRLAMQAESQSIRHFSFSLSYENDNTATPLTGLRRVI